MNLLDTADAAVASLEAVTNPSAVPMLPTGPTAALDAATPPEAARRGPTKRKATREPSHAARIGPPQIVEGRVVVEVELQGRNAAGECMLVDEWQWPRIKLALGDRWGVKVVGDHRYVVARGAKAGLRLARWLAGAGKGQVAICLNGNTLDLRTANLAVADAAEFVAEVFRHSSAN